jgi:formiminoglutamate deiminase
MTGRWWCELAWLGGVDASPGVVLEADGDGLFRTVTAGVARGHAGPATVLAGLTTPGLVNAHSHAFHRGLRGWSQGSAGGSFWTWRERMYELAGRLDPDTYRDLAAATFAEMVVSGITTVGEFHYLHHDAGGRPYDRDAMGEAIIDAAATAGIRVTVLDTCYLAGGIGRPVEGVQRRFDDGDVERWAARVAHLASSPAARAPTVRIGAAIHSVRAVPAESLTALADWAHRHEAPLHAHVSEQPAENDDCRTAYGRTPTGLLADHGVLGPRFTAVHATHLSAADVALLGASRSSVCMCPTTERDLADGIGPAAALRQAGSPICLGSDSHAVIDLWEEARAVELDERLATGRRGTHAPADLLTDATGGGARALGWADGGRLAPGAPADFCTLRLDAPALAGTLGPDGAGAAAAAVFAARAGEVSDVVVAGRRIVAGGEHVRLGPVGPHLQRAIRRAWADSP